MNDRDQRPDGGPAGTPDDLLEAAFGAARAEAMQPAPGALMARVEADALALLPWARRARPRSAGVAAAIGRLLVPVGGWPALGGFVTATAAGVWLGLMPPDAVAAQGGWLSGSAILTGAESDLALLQPEDFFAVPEEG